MYFMTKLAEDASMVGLISGDDERPYREELERLSRRCPENNLALNTTKTKKLTIGFRRKKMAIQPLKPNGG